MKTQRPLIATLLVMVFALNMLGYCVFSLLVVTHKKVIFDQILSGEISPKETCTLTRAEIKGAIWENEREFEWNGEMYDVVDAVYVDNHWVYTCKKDAKEDELIGKTREAKEKATNTKLVKITKISVQPFIHYRMDVKLECNQTGVCLYSNHHSFYDAAILTPPPKA